MTHETKYFYTEYINGCKTIIFGDGDHSNIKDIVKYFKNNNIQHQYGIDALNLSTTLHTSDIFEIAIWMFPYTNSNTSDLEDKKDMIDKFFCSVSESNTFTKNHQIILGLKSITNQ